MKWVCFAVLCGSSFTYSLTQQQLLHKAEVYIQEASYEKAEQMYARLVEKNPYDPFALFRKAQLLSWRGAYHDATLTYKHLLQRYPLYHDARLGLASVYVWIREYQTAKQELYRILASVPLHYETLTLLGKIALAEGAFSQAVSLFQMAQKKTFSLLPDQFSFALPETDDACRFELLAQALLHLSLERYCDAIALCEELLTEWPSDTEALLLQARSYAWQGALTTSSELLTSLREKEHNNPDTLFLSAQVAYWDGDSKGALSFLNTLFAIDAEHEEGHDLQTEVESAGMYAAAENAYTERRYLDAYAAIKQFRLHAPNNVDGGVLEANILIALGRYTEAEKVLHSLCHDLETSPAAAEALATISALRGANRTSYTLYAKLVRNTPKDLSLLAQLLAIQPYGSPHFDVRPRYTTGLEKDLVTGQSTTRIETFSIDSECVIQAGENIQPVLGFAYGLDTEKNTVVDQTNYSVNRVAPRVGLASRPLPECQLWFHSAFSQYTSGSDSALFPFQDTFMWQPSLGVKVDLDQHFGAASVGTDAIIGRIFTTPSSFLAKQTIGTLAYEYRWSPPYSAVGIDASYTGYSGKQSNWSTQERAWIRFLVPSLSFLRIRCEGGFSTFEKVVPAYFSFQERWHALIRPTLFYEWYPTSHIALSYTARYDTMHQLSNQGIAIENPTIDVPQELSQEHFFTHRIALHGQHIPDESFRFEGVLFYEQVNTFYFTFGAQCALRYFF